MFAPTTFDVRVAIPVHHQPEISSYNITTALCEMLMTASKTTFSCSIGELKLKSLFLGAMGI
jgi:hypothetical protein